MSAEMAELGSQIGAKYDGAWPWKGKTYYQFTDLETGSTILGTDANHVRSRISETRKLFEAARKSK